MPLRNNRRQKVLLRKAECQLSKVCGWYVSEEIFVTGQRRVKKWFNFYTRCCFYLSTFFLLLFSSTHVSAMSSVFYTFARVICDKWNWALISKDSSKNWFWVNLRSKGWWMDYIKVYKEGNQKEKKFILCLQLLLIFAYTSLCRAVKSQSRSLSNPHYY